uniref:Uncharacterized protein n=1 Tax=viral metagenome TaxID=1070528 RepID=A0A6C0K0L6_9ZZZZ
MYKKQKKTKRNSIKSKRFRKTRKRKMFGGEKKRIEYPNGDVYDGNIKNGLPDGKWKITYANGDVYDGEWSENTKTGIGKMTYANGDVYDGEWFENTKTGIGTMIYAIGNIYEGEWFKNKKVGMGTMTYVNGDIYRGHWNNDKKGSSPEPRHGIMTYANGDVYDGFWNDDVRYAIRPYHGIMTYANGDVYNGNWKNELRDEFGTMTYANGDVYEGYWKNGLRHDFGTMTYSNGEIYEGNWNNGEEDEDGDEEEEEEEEEEDEEAAVDIHKKAAKINLDKYLEIINQQGEEPYPNIKDYVLEKFIPYITEYFPEEKNNMLEKLNVIMNRVNIATDYSNMSRNKEIVKKTIDFVLKQPSNFIEEYIKTLIKECYSAFTGLEGEEGMSCVPGIIERIYMIIGEIVYQLSTEERFDEYENIETYNRLLTLFRKRVDKYEATKEWANTYLENEEKKEEIKGMTKQQRKEHYIEFIKNKYRDMDLLDEHTEKLIMDEAEKIDYVFDTLQFGGKKINKNKTKKKRRFA